jgi:hypothetical protein
MKEGKNMDSSSAREKVDNEIFTWLVNRIYKAEYDNFKTQKLKKSEMNTKIRKLIEVEADKDEN